MRSKTWMKPAGLALALTASISLAACGTTPPDRAVSGGLIGAGTGAAIGAIAGNAGAGALFGGLGGALIGAVTSPDTLNFGPVPWRHDPPHSSYYHHRHHHSAHSNSYSCAKGSSCSQQHTTNR